MDAWIRTGSCRKTKLVSDEGITTTSTELVSKAASNSCSRKIARKSKIYFRKYNADFLKFGFVSSGSEEEPMPQCVICYETLSNECMKVSKLERHIVTKHPEYVGKSIEFFQTKKRNFAMTKSTMEKTSKHSTLSTRVSYELALLIAKKGSAHTVGEELIIPAAKIISDALFDDKCTKQINEIPLSNTTVKRRIDEMSENVKEAMLSLLRKSEYFSLQFDESTDVAGQANLLAFCRFEWNGNIQEEMLFCHSLLTRTTGEEIFQAADNFMKENEIDWKKCVGLTTDGARAMSGVYNGLASKVKSVAPLVQWIHCSIHREALAVKGFDECLKKTLDDAIKIVNFIKARPKNSRLFRVLCDEMGSDHKQLLLHCEVRWLSRGKVLTRLFELRDELLVFLIDEVNNGKLSSSYLDCITDENWLKRLAYLADIFNSLNVLNLTLQGKDCNKFFVQDKIEAMIMKLQRWVRKVEQDSYDAFPTLQDFLETNKVEIDEKTAATIKDHLNSLASSLRKFFPKIEDEIYWIRNPFEENYLAKLRLSSSEEGSLIEVSCNQTLKSLFKTTPLVPFWISVRQDYPAIAKIALRHLMGFSTTYLCERAFSTLVFLKNKYRNKLNVESDLRLKLSNFNPDIDALVSSRQCQKSH